MVIASYLFLSLVLLIARAYAVSGGNKIIGIGLGIILVAYAVIYLVQYPSNNSYLLLKFRMKYRFKHIRIQQEV